MKKSIIHFVISAMVGLGLGYLVFDVIADNGDTSTNSTQEQSKDNTSEGSRKADTVEPTETANVSEGESILQTKGCLACHAAEGLDLEGGATGPDLSQAYNNVEGKHGKPLQEFLKEPTSAVMSTVIGGSPLSDEEIEQIVAELKKASEQ
ncbi:cytochrome C [Robertmurraya massiliosenegalensis]|uniref:c-type cytochrome n=1 Tax=Robertmurraya TaxID=2837507 RepID=UPI0039A603FC